MSPRSSGPQGKLSYQDREFLLSFRYSKPRFAALRKLGIARFDKSQKKWRIPLQYLPQLETHPLFSQRHIKYDFDVKAVATELEDLRNDVDSARERVAADPFSVSESDIALLEIDVVFRLARRGSSLRAFLRSGSKARGNLEKISGVQHLPSENCYFFPVEHLASFLQNLRNRNLSFAVEEQAAKYLVLGAKVRRRVIHDGECVASEDLEYAALHPYVVQVFEGKTTTFCLKCYTAEQLRKLVPDVTDYHLRRRHVAALSVDALVRMIYASRSANQTLWLSSEAQQAMDHARPGYESRLDHLSESIPDYYLGAIELEACWTTSHVGEAVLLLSDRLIQSHFASEKPWGVLKAKTAEWGDGHCGIAVRDSQVLEFFAHIEQLFTARQLPSPRVTQSFAALKRELEGRRALWLRTRQFQEMSDVELDIPDSDLPAHLFAHQRVAVRWLSENPQALLGDDMGLGKTLSILAYFEMLLKSMAAGLLVVVCPNSLTRNWLREVERWVPQRRAILLPESKTQRSECLEALEWDSADVDILVTNFETLRLDYVFPAVESIANQRYTLLCVDESQRAKNPQSKTFEALKHVAESSERRVLLSGTPTPRDITDIWAQMRLLDDGLRLGTNYFDWLHEIAELGNQ